jgi:hypothetical protein
LASSSATVAAEVHYFLLLAAFFPVIDTQCLSLSLFISCLWVVRSILLFLGGWLGGCKASSQVWEEDAP